MSFVSCPFVCLSDCLSEFMLLLKIFPFFAYIHHFKVFTSEIAEKVVIEYNRKMVEIVIQAPNLAQLLD